MWEHTKATVLIWLGWSEENMNLRMRKISDDSLWAWEQFIFLTWFDKEIDYMLQQITTELHESITTKPSFDTHSNAKKAAQLLQELSPNYDEIDCFYYTGDGHGKRFSLSLVGILWKDSNITLHHRHSWEKDNSNESTLHTLITLPYWAELLSLISYVFRHLISWRTLHDTWQPPQKINET